MPQIAKQQNRIVQSNRQIIQPIAVEIAHRAGHRAALGFQPRSLCVPLFKAAVTLVVQHSNGLRARLHQH